MSGGKKFKTLTIPYELWEWLRARAYDRKTSMVEVLRGMMERDCAVIEVNKEFVP